MGDTSKRVYRDWVMERGTSGLKSSPAKLVESALSHLSPMTFKGGKEGATTNNPFSDKLTPEQWDAFNLWIQTWVVPPLVEALDKLEKK